MPKHYDNEIVGDFEACTDECEIISNTERVYTDNTKLEKKILDSYKNIFLKEEEYIDGVIDYCEKISPDLDHSGHKIERSDWDSPIVAVSEVTVCVGTIFNLYEDYLKDVDFNKKEFIKNKKEEFEEYGFDNMDLSD